MRFGVGGDLLCFPADVFRVNGGVHYVFRVMGGLYYPFRGVLCS